MKIVGHRGAAGLVLENTLASMQAGIDARADILEFDVLVTKDGHYVVCHDDHLGRLSDSNKSISKLSYAQLQKIPLTNGDHVPLLSEVLTVAGKTPVIVEIKIRGHSEGICKILDKFPDSTITIASFHAEVVKECKQLRPHIPAFIAEHHHPFEAINFAKSVGADGIDLNYRLLSPLAYWFAKRAGLQIMVYTVNSSAIVRFIRYFYPTVWICTNYPDRFARYTKQRP